MINKLLILINEAMCSAGDLSLQTIINPSVFNYTGLL